MSTGNHLIIINRALVGLVVNATELWVLNFVRHFQRCKKSKNADISIARQHINAPYISMGFTTMSNNYFVFLDLPTLIEPWQLGTRYFALLEISSAI